MKVCVVGAGYVGPVTAACLSDMGNSVVCLDVNLARIEGLKLGQMPIHEPGLAELVLRNSQAGRLHFTTDAAATATIGQHMVDYKVIVDKSTVPVGTADHVRSTVQAELRRRSALLPFAVVSNPEFLKEGDAIEDFMRPDRIIVGAEDEQSTLLMRALYAPFLRNRDRLLVMDVRSAELTKYVSNTMLATRISFMNEMAALAERVGADIEQVRLGIGSDPRIGTHFLYAGCSWGGSCLPKDVSALRRMGAEAGLAMDLLDAVQTINQPARCHRARLLPRGHARRGCTLARTCRVGAGQRPDGCHSRRFGFAGGDRVARVPQPRLHGAESTDEDPLLLDGRNLYDPAQMKALGFEHVGIGRAQALPQTTHVPMPLQAWAA